VSEQYKHLWIEKESLSNNRRVRKMIPPRPYREDLQAHSQKLIQNLFLAIEKARKQLTSEPGSFVLKLHYTGNFNLSHLEKHGVHFVSEEDKQICIVFSDEQGLEKFKDHLSKMSLQDTGLTYKQILEALEGIENWTTEDRQSWAIRNQGFPKTDTFTLDIELWPIETTNHPTRIQLCQKFEKWLSDHQIRRIDKLNRDSLLMYRIEANQKQAEQLLNHKDIRFVDLPPKTGINYQQLNVEIQNIPINLVSPAPDSARICILDSGINANHPLIKTAIGESKSYVQNQEVHDDAGHGTAVAGIALHGDVEACLASNFWTPPFWLYNGKIMYLADSNATRFDEKTIETILIDAVKYFAEERGCRIFNLSLGNANSPYNGRHIKGMAYVLDTLARKYNILFIVSAGNFSGSEDPPVPTKSWRDEYPDYLIGDANFIIDPAPALNVLTVGSLARHNAHITEQRYPEIYALSPANENQPSPFTRHGPSVKGAFKPDLVAPGGNVASPMRIDGKQWKSEMRGMGVLTLNHNFVGNTLLKEMSGTSFAAPYITHLAGRLLNDYPQASANMLRALLVNHSNLPEECEKTFSTELCQQYKNGKTTKNRELPREVAGYGKVDEDILYRSTENAVVLMAEDAIKNDAHAFYELPLPENFLRTQRAKRELRVTLAYSPPVRTTRLNYTATSITFRLVKGTSLNEIQKHFNNDTQNENETRNDDAASNRKITAQQRDKGTVQSSIWELKQLKPNEKWFIVVTRQDRDWGSIMCLELEPYALIVTVTDRDNQEAQLYTQINMRIRQQQQARAHIMLNTDVS